MKRQFTLLLTLGLLGVSQLLFGFNIENQISGFEQYGYPRQTTVTGSTPVNFYIKHKETRDYANSFFDLEITVSDLIDRKRSGIRFRVGDFYTSSIKLDDFQDTIRVKVPLSASAISSGYIHLSIEPNFFWEDEDCSDLDQRSIWMQVTQNSGIVEKRLSFSEKKPEFAINDFLPTVENLLVEKSILENYPDLLAHTHFLFQKNFGTKLNIKALEDANDEDYHHGLVISNPNGVRKYFSEENLRNSAGAVEFKISYKETFDSTASKNVYTSSLIMNIPDREAFQKGIETLRDPELKSSAITEYMLISEVQKRNPEFGFKLKNTYTFDELGMESEEISGIGIIRRNLPLPSYLAKRAVRNLELNVAVNYRPIQKKEQGYLNVYLNNRLLESIRLDQSGILQKSIFLDIIQLSTGSYFGFEFIYIPEGGLCDRSSDNFYAVIDSNQSKISPTFFPKTPSTFASFPANFKNKSVALHYEKISGITDIETFSDIIYLLNDRDPHVNELYLPRIQRFDPEYVLDRNTDYIFIIQSADLGNSNLSKSQFIQFIDGKVSYKSDQLDRFFEFYQNEKLNYLQLFDHNNSKILLLNQFNPYPKAVTRLWEVMKDQFLTNTGNVMISNEKRYSFFDLRSERTKSAEMETRANFDTFWDQYGILLILIAFSLLLILLVYIYKKSQEAKRNIENAR